MKCPKCGSELTEDTKFCSYCGEKTIQSESVSPILNSDGTHAAESAYNSPPVAESITPSNTNKVKETWKKLSIFEKISVIGIALFALSAIVALLAGKTFAVIIAVIQIAVVIVALLMKKQIIRVSKSWIAFLALILSVVLIVPYGCLFNMDMSKTKSYKWTDIVLSNMIPKPKSHYGEIVSNSMDHLSLSVYKTSAVQYSDYIDACKQKGFTVETEQDDSSFDAYNKSGLKLSLYYDADNKEMNIGLDAAMKLETLKWPDSEFSNLIPMPKSTLGRIEKDDTTGLVVYVGKTSIDDYSSYVSACSDKGFTVNTSKTDKTFSAKNENSYKITVDYMGNNIMCISVYEPEYDVSIEIDCVENWVFSKYDVDVYIDDSFETTIEHGDTETLDMTFNKGTHKIKFENTDDDSVTGKVQVDISKNETLKFRISCTSSGIDVETVKGAASPDEPQNNQASESTMKPDNSSITQNTSDDNTTASESSKSLFYSTNDYETAKKGNTGIFSYIKHGSYDVYWIINFDEEYAYWFTEGNGESTCDKVKIISGDLNDKITVTWHDGGDEWSWKLHFKYVNHPETLVVNDHNGFPAEFTTTDLDDALSLRDSKNIKSY